MVRHELEKVGERKVRTSEGVKEKKMGLCEGRKAYSQKGRQAGGRTGGRAGRQAGRQAGGRAGRQAGRRTCRQAARQGSSTERRVDTGQAGRQARRQADGKQENMLGSMQRCTANMTLMGRVLVSGTNRAKRGTWRQIASHICNGHTHRTST
jgi:hypothetical protein